jgi:hypothetical protein
MSDQTDTKIEAPAQPDVAVPEASLVGDDNVAGVVTPTPEVNTESVPAQVTGAPAKEVDTVRVHETHVQTDQVITDTSDPRAVQVPDAGRGSLDLPIHQLGGPTVEEVFAKDSSSDDSSDSEPSSPPPPPGKTGDDE